MQSVAINVSTECVIQFDNEDKMPVKAGGWFTADSREFTRLRVTVAQSSTVFMQASAAPSPVAFVDAGAASAESIVLTDSTGAELTKDTQNTGMYVITAAGAGTSYFYISHDGGLLAEITNIRYLVDAAVTLSIEVQILALGAANWQPLPAHTSGVLAADGTSEEMNSNYPLREIITSGTQVRVAATVGGAANIGTQVIRV